MVRAHTLKAGKAKSGLVVAFTWGLWAVQGKVPSAESGNNSVLSNITCNYLGLVGYAKNAYNAQTTLVSKLLGGWPVYTV